MEKLSDSQLAASESQYRMIDVSPKLTTTRRALAEGRIYLGPLVFRKVKERSLPKGDALALAEVAGIMAAKNTAILLPLCHPIPIEAVRVTCTLEPELFAVRVCCEATATAKTGVEMEALVGVQAALLTIYDLCKGTDPNLRIGDILLLEKQGGKSGHWRHGVPLVDSPSAAIPRQELQDIRTAVITISDRCAQALAIDQSGAWLKFYCEQHGAALCPSVVVPDEVAAIQEAVMEAIHTHKAELIITTGGTGLSPRDLTPEAMRLLWDREVPGFGEFLRSSGAAHTPMAFLSRSGAGMIGRSLVLMLPGSLRAVKQGMNSLLPLLPHAFHVVGGGQHETSGH